MGKSLFLVKCIIHETLTHYHIVNYQNHFFYLANLYTSLFSDPKTQNFAQFLKCFMLIFDKALSKHFPNVGNNQKCLSVKFRHDLSQCDNLLF